VSSLNIEPRQPNKPKPQPNVPLRWLIFLGMVGAVVALGSMAGGEKQKTEAQDPDAKPTEAAAATPAPEQDKLNLWGDFAPAGFIQWNETAVLDTRVSCEDPKSLPALEDGQLIDLHLKKPKMFPLPAGCNIYFGSAGYRVAIVKRLNNAACVKWSAGPDCYWVSSRDLKDVSFNQPIKTPAPAVLTKQTLACNGLAHPPPSCERTRLALSSRANRDLHL
jgi:hypothetical protein